METSSYFNRLFKSWIERLSEENSVLFQQIIFNFERNEDEDDGRLFKRLSYLKWIILQREDVKNGVL